MTGETNGDGAGPGSQPAPPCDRRRGRPPESAAHPRSPHGAAPAPACDPGPPPPPRASAPALAGPRRPPPAPGGGPGAPTGRGGGGPRRRGGGGARGGRARGRSRVGGAGFGGPRLAIGAAPLRPPPPPKGTPRQRAPRGGAIARRSPAGRRD